MSMFKNDGLMSSHPYSRDWGYQEVVCKAKRCIHNSGYDTCSVVSKCKIAADGKCSGYFKFDLD